MDWLLANWLSLVGTLASVVGFSLTLWQISKIKNLSKAAKVASDATKDAITQNVFLVEISTMVHVIDEIKLHLRVNHHEAALLRVNDVVSLLHQAKSVPFANENGREKQFAYSIQQLVILGELLEGHLRTKSAKANLSNTNSILSDISGIFNVLIGEMKYTLKGEINNV